MEVQSATFLIRAYGEPFVVTFSSGKVWVIQEGLVKGEYDNPRAQWKPCATHAKQLVQMASGAKPTSRQAQQRAKETRPSLRVVG